MRTLFFLFTLIISTHSFCSTRVVESGEMAETKMSYITRVSDIVARHHPEYVTIAAKILDRHLFRRPEAILKEDAGRSYAYEPEILLPFLESVAGYTILEIGAADGGLSILAGLCGAKRVYVNDRATSTKDFQLVIKMMMPKLMEIFEPIQADCLTLGTTIPRASIDKIIMRNVLHFIPSKQTPILFEMFRGILVPGGEVTITANSKNAILCQTPSLKPSKCVGCTTFYSVDVMLHIGKGKMRTLPLGNVIRTDGSEFIKPADSDLDVGFSDHLELACMSKGGALDIKVDSRSLRDWVDLVKWQHDLLLERNPHLKVAHQNVAYYVYNNIFAAYDLDDLALLAKNGGFNMMRSFCSDIRGIKVDYSESNSVGIMMKLMEVDVVDKGDEESDECAEKRSGDVSADNGKED